MVFGWSKRPVKPYLMPSISHPLFIPLVVMAAIRALSPGQSPPLVRIPSLSFLAIDCFVALRAPRSDVFAIPSVCHPRNFVIPATSSSPQLRHPRENGDPDPGFRRDDGIDSRGSL